MCGIVGYVGKQKVVPILMEGLKRLEYRGYDSAGIAVLENKGLLFEKAAGKISVLESMLNGKKFEATTGIAHTRWATHGEPTNQNAHPHIDCKGEIAVVHNGIIENFDALKEVLARKGHKFTTQTDTEVLAHLIEEYFEGDLVEATRTALSLVEGTYGIAVLSKKTPHQIVVARHGSPLVIGSGEDENFVASDVSAILKHTKQVVYLKDNEMAVVTSQDFSITTIDNIQVTPHIQEISWSLDMIEKGGYPHFMLKEIFEQPLTLRDAIRGRLNPIDGTARLSGLNLQYEQLQHINRIIFLACGTSWHAGLIGEYMIEENAGIPVEVEYASEFRYRSPIIQEGTIVFAISQSGETADTLAAMREAKRKGATVLGICNVVGSSIARDTDGGVYIHAGPEIGVASTKAFTSQIMVLSLISLLLARMRNMSLERGREVIKHLQEIPEKVEMALKKEDEVKKIAQLYHKKNNFLYLGRGINFPVALEGALKLKEISYIHAEGYPAAEMKHGPIALIDENMPVVVLAIKDAVYDKVLSNIEELKARRARVIAIATEGDCEISKKVEHVIYIPKTLDMLTPLLSIIPLQLLAYHMAVLRGCNVDQPRNLAKSVTVE
ncbi:MAG: Glutamine-fructose-6-phosphate aminotransferase [isomerizing] [candidate division Zixibacteria bacterium RBG-1]|nr:MAG: Glutamine-fructose-6-phosphate aminotransferase [isomerizing] [candidate division Zixibacteria bacterium RBG-1]OGC86171.1 MAG: glutamine--fructose-6-phosphate aminotransferase [candidate division Zixibacteria bacterium RBG_19FT_COMBO_42_43]